MLEEAWFASQSDVACKKNADSQSAIRRLTLLTRSVLLIEALLARAKSQVARRSAYVITIHGHYEEREGTAEMLLAYPVPAPDGVHAAGAKLR